MRDIGKAMEMRTLMDCLVVLKFPRTMTRLMEKSKIS